MIYGYFGFDGRIIQACNDLTIDSLPAGAIGLTQEQFENRFDLLLNQDSTLSVSKIVIEPPTLDELRAKMVLTPWKFRINLVRDGWFSAVEAAIATLPKTSNIAILWEYSLQFERLNPDLIALGVQLGMTVEQMDAVFAL